MARFLSPDWMAEASAVAAEDPDVGTATAGVHLVIQQVVTGGPDGDVRYIVTIDDGSVSLRAGEDDQASVTFTLSWETAVAMATGAMGGQEAFTTGRLRLRGDVDVLLRHGSALAGLNAVFAGLRERTTY